MKRLIVLSIAVISCVGYSHYVSAQIPYWNATTPAAGIAPGKAIQLLQPQEAQHYILSTADLTLLLQGAADNAQQAQVIALPLPDGSIGKFRFWETPIFEAPLAAKYPKLKQYTAVQVDRPQVTAKLNLDDIGFHAMIFDGDATSFVTPYNDQEGTNHYLAFYKKSLSLPRMSSCETEEGALIEKASELTPGIAQRLHGTQRRIYRFALATTYEYTAHFGGTQSATLAAMAITVNRVNGIFERELAISLMLVADNDLLISTSINDPYNNTSLSNMLTQNTTNLNTVIGVANYDIGHVLGTAGGGLTSISGVCRSTKARGATGSPNPIGDAFNVDYVSHELGHQFGALHTFNGTAGACAGGRAASSAFEPGSGSTIMAYAGLCGSLNVQVNSDSYFHPQSLQHITNYVTNNTSGGGVCAQVESLNNTPPVLPSIAATYVIPSGTPFELQAPVASDFSTSEAITYAWEQWDLGSGSATQMGDADGIARPLFRSFYPDTATTRVFPQMSKILNNSLPIGESLPTISRTMNFVLTVRDFYQGFGSFHATFDTDTVKVQVQASPIPFSVTSQSTAEYWFAGNYQEITWNTAGTQTAPYNTPYVDVLLSIDGGQTFNITLAEQVPNNGSTWIMVPFLNEMSSSARIKVKGVGNVFFQVNAAPIVVMGGIALPNKLTTFTAKSSDCAALLQWSFEHTADISRVAILRSFDGKQFSAIAEVPLEDNRLDYQYQDAQTDARVCFYQLGLVAADGSITYSPIERVEHACVAAELRAYPNPTRSSFTLSTSVPLSQLRLLSISGQELQRWESLSAGQHIIDLSARAAGTYLLQVQAKDGPPQYLRIARQ